MSDKAKILLAEDDTNLGTLLSNYLKAKSFDVTLCVNGEIALTRFQEQLFDFIILDVMMPVKDGFAVAKEIRKSDSEIPILFLTAKSMKDDKLHGFDVGGIHWYKISGNEGFYLPFLVFYQKSEPLPMNVHNFNFF